MQNITRLGIPLFFGGMAATANWLYMARQFDTIEYVVARQSISPSTILTDRYLDKVKVPRAVATYWDRNFIPWAERGLVAKRSPNRSFKQGELILIDSIVTTRVKPRPNHVVVEVEVDLDRQVTDRLLPGKYVQFIVQHGDNIKPLAPVNILSATPMLTGGKQSGCHLLVEVECDPSGNLTDDGELISRLDSHDGPTLVAATPVRNAG